MLADGTVFLDLRNAFNAIHRKRIRQALLNANFSPLAGYFNLLYSKESVLFADGGVVRNQFFALGIQDVLLEASRRYRTVTIRAFVDDIPIR